MNVPRRITLAIDTDSVDSVDWVDLVDLVDLVDSVDLVDFLLGAADLAAYCAAACNVVPHWV
jgi:hypothetical protein